MGLFTADLAVRTLVVALVLFGFVPGLALRCVSRAWPKGHSRRAELRGEMLSIDYIKRPLWVCEQLETALLDGLPARWNERRDRSTAAQISATSALDRHREVARANISHLLGSNLPVDLVIFRVRRPLRVMFRRRLCVALSTSSTAQQRSGVPFGEGLVGRTLTDDAIHTCNPSSLHTWNPSSLPDLGYRNWRALPATDHRGWSLEDVRRLRAWPHKSAIAMELHAPSGWRIARRTVALITIEGAPDDSIKIQTEFLQTTEVLRCQLESDPDIMGPIRQT